MTMYAIFFPEKCMSTPTLDFNSPCYDLHLPHSHKSCKNTFVFAGTILKKLEFFRPSSDVQNVCAVTKGGTILKVNYAEVLYDFTLISFYFNCYLSFLSLQVPNPLFDLAGITCGHCLVPFWTFFGATLIGKAVIKMHLQV